MVTKYIDVTRGGSYTNPEILDSSVTETCPYPYRYKFTLMLIIDSHHLRCKEYIA